MVDGKRVDGNPVDEPEEELGERSGNEISTLATIARLTDLVFELDYIREKTEIKNLNYKKELEKVSKDLDAVVYYMEERYI